MATPKLPPITALSPIDAELRKLWDDTQAEFRKNTKKELRADPHKRLEDVLQELERKYQPKDLEEASTKKKIGETINKILKCVQMLGGLAAEGASIVFGPATLCFNAISFLIDVPGRIAAVYEGIGNLFEEVSHVLVLFHIYGDYKKLDPELKDGTHKLMVSFVRICGLSIKIIDGGTWHHIKIGAKVTFLNDDSGVKDELDNFKALIDKQSHLTEAITLKYVLDSEANIVDILENQYLSAEQQNRMETGINVLVAEASDKKMERITSERVDTIAKALSVPRDSVQGAKQALQDIRDHLLQGSLQWLLDLDAYKEWVTPVTDSIPLLLLSGDPNTGKSSLVAFIDKDLRSRNIPNVAIAYHVFTGRDAKSTRDKNKDDIVSAALKSMALQLAAQNKAYAKDLSGLKESDLKLSETHKEFPERHLWDKLQFSKDPQSQDSLNLILLFDGLDQLPEGDTSKFLDLLIDESRSSAKTDRLRLRILATGKNQREAENINNIQIVDYNEDDIKLYIERELNKDEDLQGQHVEMLDLLKSIREKLPGVASGSFSIVDQKLARIREAVDSDAYSDDLTAIIEEDPSEDPDKLAQKVISDLNTTLNAHDIKQLNELLDWAIFGYQYFSIDQLRAALFLNSGRSPLQPFEKKLKNKYRRVFNLDDDLVHVVDNIEELFQNSEVVPGEKSSVSDIDSAKITMTISINQADSRSIQRFFWDLTERVEMGRFDFTPDNSNNESKGIIHCDEVNAHYHMSEQLLKLLNDEPHEKTKPLVEYALEYLPDHLRKVKGALDEGKLGAPARKAIAKRLIDLLSDVEGIEKFWDAISNVYEFWASPEKMQIIEDWLTDEKTVAQLEPKERRWVKRHTGKSEGKGGFYKPITLMVARRWLQDRTWNAWDTYEWVDNFIKLQESKEDGGDDNNADDGNTDKPARPSENLSALVLNNGDIPAPTTPPGEEDSNDKSAPEVPEHEKIAAAATWARQALHAKEDALWYERIGQTCFQANQLKAAIEWFDKAKSLPDRHWTINAGRALAYAQLDESEDGSHLESACREMEVALTALRSLKENGPFGENDRDALVSNLKTLASWQEQLKANDRAFALYEEVLEVNSQEHQTRCDLINVLYKQNKEEEARNMLIRIKDQPDKEIDLKKFSEFLREITGIDDDNLPLNNIVMLAQTDKDFNQAMLEALQSAIDNARKNRMRFKQGVLLLYYGIVLARGTADDGRLQKAVYSWEDCQPLFLVSRYELMGTYHLAVRYRAQYYFQQATKQGASPQDVEQHFSKLLKITHSATSLWSGFRLYSFLASYYVHQGQVDNAQKLLMEDMVLALDILSDSDPDNDSYGYKILANILMHTGDDLNALSAWSLLGPNDTYSNSSTPPDNNDKTAVNNNEEKTSPTRDREGPLSYSCDGRCGHEWTYANDMYICRYCPDTQFTGDCLEKVKSNKLERYICHPDHSWLHVPAWSDAEALEVGKGRVRVHGELVDGKRVGGDILDVEVWIDEIREKWGLPKKAVEEPESEPVEEREVSI